MRKLLRMGLCALVGVAALPQGARAAGAWYKIGSTTVQARSLIPGQAATYDSTLAMGTTNDSPSLFVAGCGHIRVDFDPSYANATTGAEAQVYYCNTPTTSTTTCSKLLVDTDADGLPNNVTLTGVPDSGRIGQQWQDATWLFVHMTTAPAGSDIARTTITCFP